MITLIKARVKAVAEQQGQALHHALAEIISSSRRINQQQDGNLRLADTLIGSADPRAYLQRGFVLVAGLNGSILTTSAAARKVGSLVLTFGDGALAANVVSFPQQAENQP